MAEKPEVILLRETLRTSIARDTGTFCMVLGLVGLGILADSAAMQWVGAILFFFAFIARVRGTIAKHTYTIPQARARLDDLEAGR